MYQSLFLFLILVLSVGLPFLFKKTSFLRRPEGYSNYTLAGAMGDVPGAQTRVLVQDTYPTIARTNCQTTLQMIFGWIIPYSK